MKNKILTGLLLLMIAGVFSSCGYESKEISFVFVFDQALTSSESEYPDYFGQIAIPFEAECEEGSIGVLPKPVKISRIDINKKEIETNAWYFKDIGENTVDFSKSWLDLYFKDSIPMPYLFEPSKTQANTDAFLEKNKGNTFIYSETLDVKEYNGVKIFNESSGVLNEIKNKACQAGMTKVYILVNPKLNVPNVPLPVLNDPEPEFVSSDLNEGLTAEINRVADRKGEQASRLELASEVFAAHFEEGAKVIEVTEDGKPMNGTANGFPLVENWLKELAFSRTIESIVILEEKKTEEESLSEITVREIHRGDDDYQ